MELGLPWDEDVPADMIDKNIGILPKMMLSPQKRCSWLERRLDC